MLDYHRFKEVDELYAQGRQDEARHLLMDMQGRYIAVCDENAMMCMQVHEFEDILYLAKNLVFDGFCYWLVTGSIKQGPFCQNCYNREGALIRLDTNNGKGTCSICGHVMERDPRLTRPTHPRTSKSGARILPFRR